MREYPVYTIATNSQDNIPNIPNNSISTIEYIQNSSSNYFFSVLSRYINHLHLQGIVDYSLKKFPLHLSDSSQSSFASYLKNIFYSYLAKESDNEESFVDTLDNSEYIDVTKIPILNSFTLNVKNIYNYEELVQQTVAYASKPAITSELEPYPNSLRYVTLNNKIFIERPPFKVVVNFKPVRASGKANNLPQYEIWIPWTITEMHLSSSGVPSSGAKIFFSHSSLNSEDEKQYIPCMMPNSYSDGSICFSNSLYDIPTISSKSIRYIYSLIINEYFSGGWNLDLGLPIYNTQYEYIRSSNTSDLNEIGVEYFNPTYNSLLKRFPSDNYKTINTYIKYASSHSVNSYSKYFFKFLSSMTLGETLDFYSNFPTLSFEQIAGKNSKSRWQNEDYSDLLSVVNLRSSHRPVFNLQQNFKIHVNTFSFNYYPFILKNCLEINPESEIDPESIIDPLSFSRYLNNNKFFVPSRYSTSSVDYNSDEYIPQILSNKYSKFLDNSLHTILNCTEKPSLMHDFLTSEFEIVDLNPDSYFKFISEIIIESCMKERQA